MDRGVAFCSDGLRNSKDAHAAAAKLIDSASLSRGIPLTTIMPVVSYMLVFGVQQEKPFLRYCDKSRLHRHKMIPMRVGGIWNDTVRKIETSGNRNGPDY